MCLTSLSYIPKVGLAVVDLFVFTITYLAEAELEFT